MPWIGGTLKQFKRAIRESKERIAELKRVKAKQKRREYYQWRRLNP